MADLVKQGRTKVPKFVLVYFFSDRTTAIVDKWKCTSTDPIVDFTKKFQETPADISTSEIVKVRYPTGKSDFGTYDGYIVAVSGKNQFSSGAYTFVFVKLFFAKICPLKCAFFLKLDF